MVGTAGNAPASWPYQDHVLLLNYIPVWSICPELHRGIGVLQTPALLLGYRCDLADPGRFELPTQDSSGLRSTL